MVVVFPRIILAELNTHRVFSRNSASSRAIPFRKMVKMVKEDPFIPIAFQEDHSGMQGTSYFNEKDSKILREKHLKGRDRAIETALDMASGIFDKDEVFEFNENGELITKQDVVGVTKQIVNRYLEPFMWHAAIITSTEWENFFKLRCPQYTYKGKVFRSRKDWLSNTKKHFQWNGMSGKEAVKKDEFWQSINKGQGEIHIMALAEAMWDAKNESIPRELKAGEWHIPFGDNLKVLKLQALYVSSSPNFEEPIENYYATLENIALKVATARCARVSYMNFEGKDDYEADLKLYEALSLSGHWSPFEHCAQAMEDSLFRGNFKGWKQLRKTFINEDGNHE